MLTIQPELCKAQRVRAISCLTSLLNLYTLKRCCIIGTAASLQNGLNMTPTRLEVDQRPAQRSPGLRMVRGQHPLFSRPRREAGRKNVYERSRNVIENKWRGFRLATMFMKRQGVSCFAAMCMKKQGVISSARAYPTMCMKTMVVSSLFRYVIEKPACYVEIRQSLNAIGAQVRR